jgi:TorA maturation chaperone TorD
MINQEEYLGQALARWCLYRFLAIPFQYPEEKTLGGLDWCPKDPANLQSEYLKIFGNIVGTQCPPYETQYHGAHIFMQAQELADIAGFYRAWGLDLSEQAKERVDHIWVELEFMSYLAFKEAYAAQKGDEVSSLQRGLRSAER